MNTLHQDKNRNLATNTLPLLRSLALSILTNNSPNGRIVGKQVAYGFAAFAIASNDEEKEKTSGTSLSRTQLPTSTTNRRRKGRTGSTSTGRKKRGKEMRGFAANRKALAQPSPKKQATYSPSWSICLPSSVALSSGLTGVHEQRRRKQRNLRRAFVRVKGAR